MRMLITRLWERWPRLTLDQRRDDLDGTNNASERVIGWWIKERYRTMRGYKRSESVRNVITLTARMGAKSGNKMMSYKEGCGGCPRIPYWSNPRITYMGEPTGTAGNDAARVMA